MSSVFKILKVEKLQFIFGGKIPAVHSCNPSNNSVFSLSFLKHTILGKVFSFLKPSIKIISASKNFNISSKLLLPFKWITDSLVVIAATWKRHFLNLVVSESTSSTISSDICLMAATW